MQTYLNSQYSLKSQSLSSLLPFTKLITWVALGLFIVAGFSIGQGGATGHGTGSLFLLTAIVFL